MTDLVGVLEDYAVGLGWLFSYGNADNNNLLKSDRIADQIYLLLDPVTRVKAKSEYGGTGEIAFNGQFLLVVKSNLDNNYHNQKGQDKTTGKYEKNIKPLLDSLEFLENIIDCSDYQIQTWSVVDIINALDANTDGVIVTYSLTILESDLIEPIIPSALAKFIERVTLDGGIIYDLDKLTIDIALIGSELLYMTPTSRKLNKLYSMLATDGSGDYTVATQSTKWVTDENGVLVEVAAGIPAFSYENGKSQLKKEGQATNLVLWSEDYSQASWAKFRSEIIPNSITSPDGNLNASTLSVINATGGEEFIRTSSVDANPATMSIYVKKGNWRYITLRSVNISIFDFDTETFTLTGTDEVLSFESLNDGWYRLSSSSPTRIFCSIGFATNATTTSGSNVNGSTLYLWQADLVEGELGSPIPTFGSTVTRLADDISVTTPVGATEIVVTDNGVDEVITVIPATHQISEGLIDKVVMT